MSDQTTITESGPRSANVPPPLPAVQSTATGRNTRQRVDANALKRTIVTLGPKLTGRLLRDGAIRHYFDVRIRFQREAHDASELLNGTNPRRDARLMAAVLAQPDPDPDPAPEPTADCDEAADAREPKCD